MCVLFLPDTEYQLMCEIPIHRKRKVDDIEKF